MSLKIDEKVFEGIPAEVEAYVKGLEEKIAAFEKEVVADKAAFVKWIEKEYGKIVADEAKVKTFVQKVLKKL
jgi:hypothetical protein